MRGFSSLCAVLAMVMSTCSAHLILTYPGMRGNNLMNDTANHTGTCVQGTQDDYAGDRGCFPYGMQWMYPCGGLSLHGGIQNRSYWPLTGGAVAFQPGWFSGHSTAFLYVNLGLGAVPPNMSHPMVPPFQVVGPTNDPYPGKEVCIPQVGMPANLSLQDGQLATIQVVEAAKHGAALYSCVDVILTSNHSMVTEVTPQNCRNSSDLSFNFVYATLPVKGRAASAFGSPNTLGAMTLAVGVVVASFLL